MNDDTVIPLLGRHIIAVPVSPEIIMGQVTQGRESHFVCEQGLPEGARRCGVMYDPRRDTMLLLFEHESFPVWWDSEDFPQLDIIMHSLACDAE